MLAPRLVVWHQFVTFRPMRPKSRLVDSSGSGAYRPSRKGWAGLGTSDVARKVSFSLYNPMGLNPDESKRQDDVVIHQKATTCTNRLGKKPVNGIAPLN